MKVLAIDPGERVGWAHGSIYPMVKGTMPAPGEKPVVTEFQHLEITGHGISRLKDFALKLVTSMGDYDVVVYETYRISPAKLKEHSGSDVPTLQLVGMIRLCGWLHPKVRLVSQGPSIKKTAAKWIAARLPQVQRILDGLPKSHDDSHDGDALLHLSFYFMEKFV